MKSFDSEHCRRFAAQRLKCCWGECVGEIFIITAVLTMAGLLFMIAVGLLFRSGITNFGISNVTEGGWKVAAAVAIYIFLLYVALIPLKYGTAWFYFQEARSVSIPGSGFFSCYMHARHIRGTLTLELMVFARRFAAAIFPLVYIVFMVWHIGSLMKNDPAAGAAALAFLAIAGTLLVFIYIIFHLRYIFVPYLYASDPEKPPKQIIAESVRISMGSRIWIIKLLFSLFPFWLCCLAIFPMPFVTAYTKMTFAVAASEIFNEYCSEEQGVEEETAEDIKEESLV